MKKSIIKKFIFLFFIFLLVPAKHYAADDAEKKENTIILYRGETKIIPVNSPNRIVIGNPAIADVVSATKNQINLSAKTTGSTILVFWDINGEQSIKVIVYNENMQEIKRRIDNLLAAINLPNVRAQASDEEGKVFILGSVKTPQEREKIFTVLGGLKDKTLDLLAVKEEESAIEIDVQLLELNTDSTTTLGLTSPSSLNITEVGSAALTGTSLGSLFRIANLQRGAFGWTLNALVQQGKARVLSRPKLACQSGKEAELLVGGEKPTFTTNVASAGGEGTSVEYKEFGIKLKIKPTITDNNRVKVNLNVEVSEVGAAETIGPTNAPSAKAYPLSKRNVTTELYLDNEETLAIGGLMKRKHEEDVQKTWGLGDIPIIGLLFRKTVTTEGGGSGERGNTELFITLTPSIVGLKKEEIKKATEEVKPVQEPKKDGKASAEVPEATVTKVSQPLDNYISIITKRIYDKMTYPLAAKNSGIQGTVKITLHLSYMGKVSEVLIKQSSGYKILDDNATSVAKNLVSYPPFPPTVQNKELWVDVPITYRLE